MIDQQTVDFYQHNGAVCLRRLLTPGQVAVLRAGVDLNLARPSARCRGWDPEPGDVVGFHMLTLHAAAGVSGPHRRRVFSVRFLGDDIRHAPRRWRTSPEFPGLSEQLAPGAPMQHALFPLLWQS